MAIHSEITLQGLKHFDEILQEADGIILSRGNLGIDLPPEKVSEGLIMVHITLKCTSNIYRYVVFRSFCFKRLLCTNATWLENLLLSHVLLIV